VHGVGERFYQRERRELHLIGRPEAVYLRYRDPFSEAAGSLDTEDLSSAT
jgi:hypothetical protein